MWLVVLGVVAVGLKLAGLGFVGDLSWWWVLSPFALAAVWWQVADSTGITQRRAMERAEKRAADRRESHFEAMGLRPGKGRKGTTLRPGADKGRRGDG